MCGQKSRRFYLRFGGLLLLFLLFFSVCSLSAQDVREMTDQEIIEQLLLDLEKRESLLIERESILRTRDAILTERESILESRENSLEEREQSTQEWESLLTETENSLRSYRDATEKELRVLRWGLIGVSLVGLIEAVILGLSALAP